MPGTILTNAVALYREGAGERPNSIYRKLGASTRSQAAARSRELGLLDGGRPVFHPLRRKELTPVRGGMVPGSGWRHMGQTVRFQETLRRPTMIGEGFVEYQAGLGLGLAAASALDPKTAALLQVGVTTGRGRWPVLADRR